MSLVPFWKRKRVFLAALAAGGLLIAAGQSVRVWVRNQQIRSRPLRIGADHSPPYYFLQPGGKVEGLAVDVLNEAARRSGIRLQWIPIHDFLDNAFRDNAVDLWPAVASTNERVRKFYLTEPWLRNNYALISPVTSGIRRETRSDE